MLIGKRLKLCAIEESHLGTLAQWRSDPAVYDYFHEYVPISVPAQREWFDAHRREPSEIDFASVLHDGTLIGTISLVDLDLRNRNAELGRDEACREVGRATGDRRHEQTHRLLRQFLRDYR